MNNPGVFLAFLAGVSLYSCHLFQKSRQEEIQHKIPLRSEMIDSLPASIPPVPVTYILRVRQMGCGGPCPEWEARFYPSGEGAFTGARAVANLGAFQTKIHPDSILQWRQKAGAIGFFALPDSLPQTGEFLKDLPTLELEIRSDSIAHTVVYNHHGPVSLRKLEQQLETWILALPWERIDQ